MEENKEREPESGYSTDYNTDVSSEELSIERDYEESKTTKIHGNFFQRTLNSFKKFWISGQQTTHLEEIDSGSETLGVLVDVAAEEKSDSGYGSDSENTNDEKSTIDNLNNKLPEGLLESIRSFKYTNYDKSSTIPSDYLDGDLADLRSNSNYSDNDYETQIFKFDEDYPSGNENKEIKEACYLTESLIINYCPLSMSNDFSPACFDNFNSAFFIKQDGANLSGESVAPTSQTLL